LTHYFIGIQLPTQFANALHDQQQGLKAQLNYKQWTHQADFHITLQFFGAVAHTTLAKLKHNLKQIEKLKPFTCTLEGLDFFGHPEHPRVLLQRVTKAESLLYLYERITEITGQLGFLKEKRAYKPHVTMAKKCLAADNLQDVLQTVKQVKGPFEVKEVFLFRIEPTQTPRYVSEAVFALKGGGSGWLS